MQQRFKRAAGMGSRGKNQPKNIRLGTKPSRRKASLPKLPKAQVFGKFESFNLRKRNQKNNQRKWHSKRAGQI
jgi:hypothetical protein